MLVREETITKLRVSEEPGSAVPFKSRQKLADAGITKVTDYYTSEFKYPKELHRRVSKMLIETLQEQGLWL